MSLTQSSKVFWIRLDDGTGELTDPFRVKLHVADADEKGGWKLALVEDLKEQMIQQNSALFLHNNNKNPSASGSTIPLPLVSLWLPGGEEGSKGTVGEVKLSPTTVLGSLPEGAGSASWHLVARVASRSTGERAEASSAETEGRPRTLYEQGLADENEPEQIKNATDLSELYPGGKLPRSTMSGSACSKCCKVMVIFGCFFAFAMLLVYFLSVTLPELTGAPAEVPAPKSGLRRPDIQALLLGMWHKGAKMVSEAGGGRNGPHVAPEERGGHGTGVTPPGPRADDSGMPHSSPAAPTGSQTDRVEL